jgi:MFS family permease
MDDDLKRYYKFRSMLLIMTIWVMMIISIYQYSWSLFAFALSRELKWDLATVGLAFTVFAYTATFIQPFSGYIADSLSILWTGKRRSGNPLWAFHCQRHQVVPGQKGFGHGSGCFRVRRGHGSFQLDNPKIIG